MLRLLFALILLSTPPVLAGPAIVLDLDGDKATGPDIGYYAAGDTVELDCWIADVDSFVGFGVTVGGIGEGLDWVAESPESVYSTPAEWSDTPVHLAADSASLLLQSTDFSLSNAVTGSYLFAELKFVLSEGDSCFGLTGLLSESGLYLVGDGSQPFDSCLGAVVVREGAFEPTAPPEEIIASCLEAAAPEGGGWGGTEEDSENEGPESEGDIESDSYDEQASRLTVHPNTGAFPEDVRYYSHQANTSIYFKQDGFVVDHRSDVHINRAPGLGLGFTASEDAWDRLDTLTVSGTAWSVTFSGANSGAELVTEDPLTERINRISESKSQSYNPTRVLRYEGLYDGIGLEFYDGGGYWKYDIIVEPGADLAALEFLFDGIDSLSLDAENNCQIHIGNDVFVEGKPVIEDAALDNSLKPRYVRRTIKSFGVQFDNAEELEETVRIDPGLLWSAFIGGSAGFSDEANDVCVLPSGEILVVGETQDPLFPTTLGAYETTYQGVTDGFLSKCSADGSRLIFSTFIGGTDLDVLYAASTRPDGAIVVAGYTRSSDFPEASNGIFGTEDGIVALVSGNGDTLIESHYVGLSGNDQILDLAISSGDTISCVGTVVSSDFTDQNMILARLRPDGFGGYQTPEVRSFGNVASNIDIAQGVALDPFGNPVIVGATTDASFPTTAGSYDPIVAGQSDAIIMKWSKPNYPNGGADFVTSLRGGSPEETQALDVVVNPLGDIYLTGYTHSLADNGGGSTTAFSVTYGAYDTLLNDANIVWGSQLIWVPADAFVVKMASDGSSVLAGTYVGGQWPYAVLPKGGDEVAYGISLDSSGSIVIVGFTDSYPASPLGFPTTPDAYDQSYNFGISDLFMSRLSPDLSTLEYSTLIGGNDTESEPALAINDRGFPVVVGFTRSGNFPFTSGSFDTTFGGAVDGFVLTMYWPEFVGVETHERAALDSVSLRVAPNPFNPTVELLVAPGSAQGAVVEIFEISGRRVRRWVLNHDRPAQSIVWNGTDESGRAVSSGAYFVRLSVRGQATSKKIHLVR